MAMDLLEKPGADSRSSSPSESRSSCPGSTLKFSIERILSSEFGVRNHPHSPRDHPPPEKAKDTSSDKNVLFFASSKPEEAILSTALMSEMPWLYASRTSCRPSSGPRRIRSKHSRKGSDDQDLTDDPESPRTRRIRKSKESDKKRPRTAFNDRQLQILRAEFEANRYLTEKRRLDLSKSLNLNESQVKIWFQNRRAKCKRSLKHKSPLALQLMAKGLYNHSTIAIRDDEDDEKSKS